MVFTPSLKVVVATSSVILVTLMTAILVIFVATNQGTSSIKHLETSASRHNQAQVYHYQNQDINDSHPKNSKLTQEISKLVHHRVDEHKSDSSHKGVLVETYDKIHQKPVNNLDENHKKVDEHHEIQQNLAIVNKPVENPKKVDLIAKHNKISHKNAIVEKPVENHPKANIVVNHHEIHHKIPIINEYDENHQNNHEILNKSPTVDKIVDIHQKASNLNIHDKSHDKINHKSIEIHKNNQIHHGYEVVNILDKNSHKDLILKGHEENSHKIALVNKHDETNHNSDVVLINHDAANYKVHILNKPAGINHKESIVRKPDEALAKSSVVKDHEENSHISIISNKNEKKILHKTNLANKLKKEQNRHTERIHSDNKNSRIPHKESIVHTFHKPQDNDIILNKPNEFSHNHVAINKHNSHKTVIVSDHDKIHNEPATIDNYHSFHYGAPLVSKHDETHHKPIVKHYSKDNQYIVVTNHGDSQKKVAKVLSKNENTVKVTNLNQNSEKNIRTNIINGESNKEHAYKNPGYVNTVVETGEHKHEHSIKNTNNKINQILENKNERAKNDKITKTETKTRVQKVPEAAKHHRTQTKEDNNICLTAECSISATSIIESLDVSVDPCQDFFSFVCGGFIKNHPVNETYGPVAVSNFDASYNLLNERLEFLLGEDASASDPEPIFMIRRQYDSCMNTDLANSLGITPLWNQITNGQGGWPMIMDSWNEATFDLEGSMVALRGIGIAGLVSSGIDADLYDTTHKVLYVSDGELGIPLAVLSNSGNYATEIGYYKTFISDSAKLVRDGIGSSVSDANIDTDTQAVIDFEIQLSQIIVDEMLNISDNYATINITGLQTITDKETPGQIDWLKYFRVLFTSTSVIINADEPIYLFGSEYLSPLSTLLSTTPKRTIANYLGWWWTMTLGSETTYAMSNVTFAFERDFYGRSIPEVRSLHCVTETNGVLGFPTSRAYVDAFFPNGARDENRQLVEDIQTAYQSLLDENDWMTAEDIVVAKEKLDAVLKLVAYPDWIMDDAALTNAYDGLIIRDDELLDNIVRIGAYYQFWELELFRQEPPKTFLFAPTVVNAFYNWFMNSITILAGILQPPFYTHNSLAALNYGGIGYVIGHEFTHGFDNSGRHFDANGSLATWWSQETIDAFNNRSQCFVDQYNEFQPPEFAGTQYNATVNGAQTLGENIADNGGIHEAFRAYKEYVQRNGVEPKLPGLDEFTSEQMFFIGAASVHCGTSTPELMMSQILTDVHSPGRFRVLGPFSNDEDFWDTWNCPSESPMNRGAEACVLW